MDHTKQNKKFTEEYVVKNDGSLADNLVKGMKKHFAEEEKLTPAQKRKRRQDHYKKMKNVIKGMGYVVE